MRAVILDRVETRGDRVKRRTTKVLVHRVHQRPVHLGRHLVVIAVGNG